MATVSAGPTPGSTPMKVPSVTPMKPQRRLSGVSAMLNPCRRNKGVVHTRQMPAPPRIGCSQPAGKLTFRNLTKKRKTRQAEDKADGKVARHFRAAESARHTGEQHGLGEHETGGVDQKNLGEQTRR